jgi:hypothetical protein
MGFITDPMYDLAVNTILLFTAVSFTEPAVEGFSPPTTRPMPDA